MGLFDSYYDPQSYQGGAGLIDRILAQLGTQGQYQPGTGFAPSPMDANAAAPPQVVSAPQVPTNAPIAVGNNYMMPRIGRGFPEIDPRTGDTVTPQYAAPQMQQPMQAMAQMQPQAPQANQGIPDAFLQPGGGGVGGFVPGPPEG